LRLSNGFNILRRQLRGYTAVELLLEARRRNYSLSPNDCYPI
jgi:hypothetical protein